LRLLLDEHLSPEIARQLRNRGHDVVAVGEHPDLKGRSDHVHFACLADEQRVIVTQDLRDFRPLLAAAMRTGTPTYGLICVSRRFQPSGAQCGRLVRALDHFLERNPDADAVMSRGGELWLEDPDDRGL
jgi:predicted nuclease of predicted toxin-antitoxin system